MRASIRYKAVVVLSGFSVAMILASGRAAGQQIAEGFHTSTGLGATVSVATLRIPERAWRHFAKAKTAAEHNRLAEFDRETQKALEIAPNFAEAYLLRADSEVQEHAYEAAIENVKEARRVEPDVQWAGVILAGAYNGLRRYEEARFVLSKLHGCEAGAWQAAYEGARAAVGLKDMEEALSLSALALNSAPDSFIDVHLVRSNAFILARRWTDAQAQIEAYLRSKIPEGRRNDVLMALAMVKQRAQEEELQKIAVR